MRLRHRRHGDPATGREPARAGLDAADCQRPGTRAGEGLLAHAERPGVDLPGIGPERERRPDGVHPRACPRAGPRRDEPHGPDVGHRDPDRLLLREPRHHARRPLAAAAVPLAAGLGRQRQRHLRAGGVRLRRRRRDALARPGRRPRPYPQREGSARLRDEGDRLRAPCVAAGRLRPARSVRPAQLGRHAGDLPGGGQRPAAARPLQGGQHGAAPARLRQHAGSPVRADAARASRLRRRRDRRAVLGLARRPRPDLALLHRRVLHPARRRSSSPASRCCRCPPAGCPCAEPG